MRVSKREAKAMNLLPGSVGVKINPYAPYRSKWESDYAEELCAIYSDSPLQRDVRVRYEAVTFTLVPASEHQRGVRYTPDFTIWRGIELSEVIEVKGHWRPGAKHKVKALAHMLAPIPVFVVRKEAGKWTKERF